ncbi:hypothetical protein AB0J42_04980 [Nonomuraea sp. NPDC049649]|uniref:hypothetical protein n=1 Tax=Nonomuraea sp. NPDC049649 TaxID=3155776 RepID=UPI0034480A53
MTPLPGRAVLILLAALLLTACGGEHRVDPGALAEVRSIGQVVAEATSRWYWGDQGPRVTSRNETFVVDMGTATSGAALERARARLAEHGWRPDPPGRGDELWLRSARWEELSLFAQGLDDYVRQCRPSG